ncbi:flagellar basal body rod C-terminal domain-containing protein [Buchnera aphidicola]|uniref:flagellar basal body rod C-terminal domain-containing protein n=1 Tax=Buchnera aphidicola TaxID=9 RepID=UPI0031B6BE3B
MNKILRIVLNSANNNLMKQKVIANNIANVSTAGFKEQYVYNIRKKDRNSNIKNINNIVFNFTRGNFRKTNNPINVSAKDNYWISIIDTDDTVAFMQTGKFHLNEKNELLLNEYPVLTTKDETIVCDNHKMPRILEDGKVVLSFKKNNKIVNKFLGQIKLIKLLPEDVIHSSHGKYFLRNSGMKKYQNLQLRDFYKVPAIANATEGSNVDLTENLINMLDAMRDFESNIQVISNEHENEDKANNLLNGVIQ